MALAYQRLSPSARTEYSESLAYHYDRGKEVQNAIDFYYLSGEKARQGYANSAAVAHFTRGLELLRGCPQGPTSLDRELEFLISLGVPLVLAKGHQDPTVEAVHLRAKAICEERGSPLQRFLVNLGLNRHYSYSRQRLHYGQQMLDIARGLDDERLISRAHGMLAESFFYFGDFQEMRAHAEAGQAHCQPAGSSLDLIQFGNDTSAIVMITRSLALWGFGFMTQSAAVMQEDLTRARTLGHAFTLCMVIFYACLLSFMRREQHQARPLSEELFSLAQREGFALYIGYGLVLRGWSGGDPHLIRQGIEMLPRHPFPCAYACMLAELYLADGGTDSAIETLDNALTQVRETHLHLWEPEVHRLRGKPAASPASRMRIPTAGSSAPSGCRRSRRQSVSSCGRPCPCTAADCRAEARRFTGSWRHSTTASRKAAQAPISTRPGACWTAFPFPPLPQRDRFPFPGVSAPLDMAEARKRREMLAHDP